jgi:hypothetical protein
LIPAAPAQRGGVAQSGKNLVRHDHAGEKALAINVHGPGKSQQRAQTVARVTARIAIIEIEIANHRRIDKRRAFHRQPVSKIEDSARIFPRRLTARQSPADLRRLAIVSADSTTE